jgi:site-specific recombinase XerC
VSRIEFLHPTARVQEIAELPIEHLDLGSQPRVRLHGKGDKWRVCPLWSQTVEVITRLLQESAVTSPPTRALFTSNVRARNEHAGATVQVNRWSLEFHSPVQEASECLAILLLPTQ